MLTVRRSLFALATATLAAALLGASTGARASAPDEHCTRDRRAPSPAATDEACERCHATESGEWRASAHRAAATDPTYVAALRAEPLPFCRACHAPAADPSRDTPPSEAARGVGCTSCHAGGDPARPRPCAACHEFAFPGRDAPMQSTAREHAASRFAEARCEACHMPLRTGRRDHRFAVDVASALDVSARREGSAVTLSLTPRGVGHAFPTGDLFRRLRVVVEALGPDWSVRARDERVLARRFEWHVEHGARVRVEVGDDRLVGPRELRFELGAAAAASSVAYRVTYERPSHPLDDRGDRVELAGAVVVAEGVLAASRR